MAELEKELRSLSHDDTALRLIQNFAASLGKTKNRQEIFNKKGALVRSAILMVQVSLADLILARRYASLSLVGWRIFGSLIRNIMVRAGDSEVNMRASLDSRLT